MKGNPVLMGHETTRWVCVQVHAGSDKKGRRSYSVGALFPGAAYFLLCPHPTIDLTPPLLWQPPQFLRTFIPTTLSFEANYSASTTVLIVLSLGTLQPLLRGHAWRFSWDGARCGSEPSTPAPTPAIIAVGHTAIPLAETLPTCDGSI
ncbi:hypothetical protein R3P38DRAFT_3204251 [Favolaschia claudopus]|uniref:Uncharacterized protein n=1 Tax=Favolaschia claudopus TaxID=2862362 RepID=A0AAW0ARS8_9AGAR